MGVSWDGGVNVWAGGGWQGAGVKFDLGRVDLSVCVWGGLSISVSGLYERYRSPNVNPAFCPIIPPSNTREAVYPPTALAPSV